MDDSTAKHSATFDPRKMFELAEQYTAASSLLDEQSKRSEWAAWAPKMLVDSFAVELYLKCLYVLETQKKPKHDHDWRRLFDRLTAYSRTGIREAFESIINSDPVLPLIRVRPDINPDAVRFLDFDRSLDAASKTFEHRRYLYDVKPDATWAYAHFMPRAIRQFTASFIKVSIFPEPAPRKN